MFFFSAKALPAYFKITILLVLTSFISIPACSTNPSKKVPEAVTIPEPGISSSANLKESANPADLELCESINGDIESRNSPNENWGVFVVDVEKGTVICKRKAKSLFAPASVQKILTAVVATAKLGSDYRFKTSVYSDSAILDGTVEGDLVLYGRGAPDFDKPALLKLVEKLKKKGIRKIRGDIVGDSSYFHADGLGDGWTWNEAQWYYGAAASALSFERNNVRISVRNGKPSANTEFVGLTSDLEPKGKIEAIGVKRRLGTNEVFIWGTGDTLDARIAVNNPGLFTARIFRELLLENGVAVNGDAAFTDWQKPTKSEKHIEIASVESAALSDLLRTMNRDSVNLYAELLIRTLGKQFGAEAPDDDLKLNKLRGDDMAGTAVLRKHLEDNGISTGSLAVHDGSGLSRLDRLTPESIVRTLILALNSKDSAVFIDSLPVSGKSGTLRGRLKNMEGRVRAKTGSIKYVNSLAGYVQNGKGTYAFAVICNDETDRSDSTETIDQIISRFAEVE